MYKDNNSWYSTSLEQMTPVGGGDDFAIKKFCVGTLKFPSQLRLLLNFSLTLLFPSGLCVLINLGKSQEFQRF